MKKLLLVIFLLLAPSLANAQASKNDLIGLGMAPELANELVKGTVSNSSYIIQVDNDPQRKFTFDASSDTALTMTFGDGSVTDNQNFYIQSGVTDSAQDDGVLCITGGGTPSDARGSFICSYGNDHSNDGLLTVAAGADAGSDLHLQAKDDITMFLGSDSNRMINFDSSSDTALEMRFGDGGTTASQLFSIMGSTSDADDDGGLVLSGGGAASISRGANLILYGNEVSGAEGHAIIRAGASVGDVTITSGDDVIIQGDGAGDIITLAGGGTGVDLTIADTTITVAAGTTFDAGSATAVLEVPNGTDLPATCSVGSIFVDSDDNACADAGGGTGATCVCQATNTWVEVS